MLQTQNPYVSSAYNLPYQQSFVPGNMNQSIWSNSSLSNAYNLPAAHSYRFQPMSSAAVNFNNSRGFQPVSTAFASRLNNFNPGLQNNFNNQTSLALNTTGGTNWTTGYRSDFGITQPSIDVSETKDDVILACDLPNVNLNDLNLTVSENSCSISAQSMVNGQSIAMHRTVPLSTCIRSDAVDANYSNGILQVRMPKKDVKAKKDIKVNFK